jgi:hypothetical protein
VTTHPQAPAEHETPLEKHGAPLLARARARLAREKRWKPYTPNSQEKKLRAMKKTLDRATPRAQRVLSPDVEDDDAPEDGLRFHLTRDEREAAHRYVQAGLIEAKKRDTSAAINAYHAEANAKKDAAREWSLK